MNKKSPNAGSARVARSDLHLLDRGGQILRLRLQPEAATQLRRLARDTTTTAAIHAAILGAAAPLFKETTP